MSLLNQWFYICQNKYQMSLWEFKAMPIRLKREMITIAYNYNEFVKGEMEKAKNKPINA